jgi:DNA-directed RNA polymerase specialized sigma24 family protein
MANALLMSRAPSGIFKTMDEQLTQLVTAAQQHSPQTEARQVALARLVEAILRSRKLGRSPLGQPLAGIYRQIYEQVRQQLLSEVNQHLSHYNPKQMSVRAWARSLQHQAFRKILNDAQLKQLAIEAQRHRPGSELRQHALGELVEAIQLSGKLCRPHRANFSPQFYDLVYDEAVNKTLTYVCRKIDLYDPERGDKKFMNWVNFRLERVFIESCREFRDPNVQDLPSLNELEAIVQPREPPSLFTRVREGIEADTDNIFKQAHIRNRPDANFQVIALARFSGKTWEEISANYNIPLPTLSRFFQRCCEKFRPQLKE